jgi:hypothetical protein
VSVLQEVVSRLSEFCRLDRFDIRVFGRDVANPQVEIDHMGRRCVVGAEKVPVQEDKRLRVTRDSVEHDAQVGSEKRFARETPVRKISRQDVDGLADAGIADTNCAFRGRNCRWVGHAWHHTPDRSLRASPQGL